MLSIELSQTSEYALRAMACIALLRPAETISAKDLSQETNIPVHYLSKIMRKLVEHRLVQSQKGHGGGFLLAKSAKQIRFADILVAAGYETNPDRCVFGWTKCKDEKPCPLHDSWSQLNSSFQDWVNNSTLADVQNSNSKQNNKK